MGDANQIAYLKRFQPSIDGPVLEVGSKDYGSTSSFRDFYSNAQYVGLDMAEGKGVDVIADLTSTIGPLPENHFALAVCCSVVEHVKKPWLFAANLTRLVRPGGKLYISVPWVWRYHPYPDDYFRISHHGVISLFEEFEWNHMLYSTTVLGEFVPIELNSDNKMAVMLDLGAGKQRKYLPYLNVNMLGTRVGPQTR